MIDHVTMAKKQKSMNIKKKILIIFSILLWDLLMLKY